MSFFRYACPLVLLALAAPAHADVTAEDVWGDWQAYVTGFGYAIAGQERRDGDLLVVENVTISGGSGAESVETTLRIDSLSFTENGDGTVAIGFPQSMPLEMTATDVGGIVTKTTMDYRQTGLSMTASGTPTELVYDYAADAMSIATTALEVNGDILGADAGVEASLQNLSGRSTSTLAAMRNIAQTITAENVTYTLNSIDPATETKGSLTGSSRAVQFDGTNAMPLSVVQASDMNELLKAGFSLDGTFTYQDNTTNVATETPQGPFAMTFASDNGTLDVTMGEAGLTYVARQSDLKADVTTTGFPVPLQFAVADAAINLTMPLQKSDTPDDIALGFNLGGFTMSDVLWGVFDPTGQLPRDPATVLVDLTGKARLLFDFLDPAAALQAADPNAAPAEFESLDINRLMIALAGAELTGNGAFTFKNDPASGSSTPVGGVNVKLVGGNGLLDKLVALNLVPEQDAMGARLMMGLLAVPGQEPDTLTSKIEVNEDWHIFANGQRIQ